MKKNRTFKQGRGSEQLFNQEMYDIFLAVKDINPDMTEQEKVRLDEQLEQAAKQLVRALRALRTGQAQHAAVYVGNVQNLLPGLRMRLVR